MSTVIVTALSLQGDQSAAGSEGKCMELAGVVCH